MFDNERQAYVWFDKDPARNDPDLEGLSVKLKTPYLKDKRRMWAFLRALKWRIKSRDKDGNLQRWWSAIEEVWAFSPEVADKVMDVVSEYFPDVELIEDPGAIADGKRPRAVRAGRLTDEICKKVEKDATPEVFQSRELDLDE